MHELVNGEVASDRSQQSFDGGFIAVYIKEAPNNLRGTNRIDALDVDLDELRKPVLIQIENEIVHEVETIADNNERELVRELGLFEEVLDFLRVVEVALPTDTLHFTDLTCPGGSLNVLEVNLRILAKVDHRS
jgi:hypothetical protein